MPGRKIDKGRKSYTYSGDPKSYWDFCKNRTPAGPSETPEMKAKREARQADLDRMVRESEQKRAAERKAIRRKLGVNTLKGNWSKR